MFLLVASFASTVSAQAERQVAVGVSVGLVSPAREDWDTGVAAGPILRVRSRRGWAPAVGFSWFSAESEALDLRIRPFMLGVAYNLRVEDVSVSPSFVAGYAFNSVEMKAASGERAELSNSLAWRPGVSVWWDVTDRIGLNTFVGYLMTRPELDLGNVRGSPPSTVKADAFIWTTGVAVWMF